MSEDLLRTGFDPNRRELCPDGACIGVIGADGLCKECGAPSPNGPPRDGPEAEAEAALPKEPTAAPKTETVPNVEDEDHAPEETDGFDPNHRELCPDGACVGVVGPDGKCKECGRQAE
ncbi:MAG: hypothetical protein ABI333_28715 [bacterium]